MPQIKSNSLSPLSISLVLLLSVLSMNYALADYPELNQEELNWLGDQIFNNECSRRPECLTSWNAGEDFPSLGLGHFIWFQHEQEEIFEESFPQLLLFLQSRSIEIPQWLTDLQYDSPWQTREEFLKELNEPRLSELRQFLISHIAEQTEFIIQRFTQALDKITASEPDNGTIEERFLLVANASPPYGLYALIDYVNFKGEGVSELEQYNNQGWGLKQVLNDMSNDNNTPLEQFVISAKKTLATRVTNSPLERNETRWINGWNKRVDTYLPAPKRSE